MRVLFVGDTVGRLARTALGELLPSLKKDYQIDFTVINGENAAGGIGLTVDTARELCQAGADVITSGNHIFAHKEIENLWQEEVCSVVRPLNYPSEAPGRGFLIKKGVAVVNLLGRVFIGGALDCPFKAMDNFLSSPHLPKIIIVDMHAEATSEKKSMGYYLDGRVSAVLGTHTHVPTADEQILPQGTAYISDVGMCGSRFSVIGDEPQDVIRRFLVGVQSRLPVAQDRHQIVNAVVVDIDESSGRAVSIERIVAEVWL